jgi:glycosyltransferase involved in cell wall biosynthesis
MGVSGGPRIAYVMSRFPKLTETFVLFEIVALEDAGHAVEVYPLLRERQPVMHAAASRFVERAHYLPVISIGILGSQIHFLLRHPRRYLGALAAVVRGTWGSRNFLLGGLGIFPKVAHMARLMDADGIDHVHCHFANHPALAGFIIGRLTGIPYSFTAHGSDLHVDRHMLCTKVAEADFVVPISNYNRDLIVSECGAASAARLVVIHTGVDTDHFRPRPRPSMAGPFTIACVGTLHEVKGQVHLVRACSRLAARGTNVVCHLVGDGPDRPMLEREIAAAGLEGKVVLDGMMDRDALASLLAECDVLVAPSVPTAEGKREGIPVVLMEAMSSGLPVVASRLSGIPELVEDEVSGLLVEPGDADGLADALARLEHDPALRERLAESGRRTVTAEFDVRENARRLVEQIGHAPSQAGRQHDERTAPHLVEESR